MTLGKKQARQLVNTLKEVSRCASYKSARFGTNYEKISYPTQESEVTPFVICVTRLHRQTWIEGPLNDVILALEKFI